MTDAGAPDFEAIAREIRALAHAEKVRVTLHAQQEMLNEEVTLDDVLHALAQGRLIENYPEHKRGACCLVCGATPTGRPLHVVCTTARPMLVIITVYEPKEPKWVTPTQRRPRG